MRMGSLGDIVHALPAAATLKRAYPEAEIDWLVERPWVPLLANNPHLARLQVVETRSRPIAADREQPWPRGYSRPSMSPRSFARPVARLLRMNARRPMKSTSTSPKGR